MLGNPFNRHRAIPLTYDQFRFAFANLVTEDEAHQLYETYAVPASGAPLFQAASANLNPWTEAKADYENRTAGRCRSSPASATTPHRRRSTRPRTSCSRRTRAAPSWRRSRNRGHSLTIDSGWREVCDTALTFLKRFA